MPRGSRRRGTGARIGRPPRPDAGNWEKFYVLLKTDTAGWIRSRAQDSGLSLSHVIAEMVNLGVAQTLEREREQVL